MPTAATVALMPTPQGWYPDPYSDNQDRYWDGVGWTDATRATTPGTPTASYAVPRARRRHFLSLLAILLAGAALGAVTIAAAWALTRPATENSAVIESTTTTTPPATTQPTTEFDAGAVDLDEFISKADHFRLIAADTAPASVLADDDTINEFGTQICGLIQRAIDVEQLEVFAAQMWVTFDPETRAAMGDDPNVLAGLFDDAATVWCPDAAEELLS